MKVWPLKIQRCVGNAQDMVADKMEIFSAKLLVEQEEFVNQIKNHQ